MRWVILCCVRLIIWAVSISCESYHDVYHCPEPQYIPVWVYSTGLATETWEGLLRELRHCLPRNNLHNLIFILWLSVNYHWQKVYEFPTYQNKTSVFVLKLLCHRCEACPRLRTLKSATQDIKLKGYAAWPCFTLPYCIHPSFYFVIHVNTFLLIY